MVGEEETGTYRSQRMEQGAMGLGIMGQRQVTPRLENNPVWINDYGNGCYGLGGRGYPPPPGRKQEAGREGWSRLRRIAYS